MKWLAYNACGSSAWLAGLFVAKTGVVPGANIVVTVDHNFTAGFLIAGVGLAMLVWTNVAPSSD